MNLALLNSYLESLEAVRLREVGGCSYALTNLSSKEALLEAVVQHLSARGAYESRFPLELSDEGENWGPAVKELVAEWVFGKDERPQDWSVDALLLNRFAGELEKSFSGYSAFDVVGEGTMLPATIWNAIALTNGDQNWLLEFGWSD